MAALDQRSVKLTLKVSIAWWLKPYCYTLAAICALTGHEPNYKRVHYWIGRAVKVKAK